MNISKYITIPSSETANHLLKIVVSPYPTLAKKTLANQNLNAAVQKHDSKARWPTVSPPVFPKGSLPAICCPVLVVTSVRF